MAKVTGPLFSMNASGTIGKALTYGIWKGINWVRGHVIPANPKSDQQVNVRTALTLMVALWQSKDQAAQDKWNVFAEGTGMSGYNKFMERGMKEYPIQLTVDVTPLSVVYAGDPPADVWTWLPVV